MRKTIAYTLLGLSLAAVSGTAAARPNIDIGISFGIPAPVFVVPRPPIAYYPAPVYAPPPPVYYGAPVYYGPTYYDPPVVYRERGRHRHHHRGHGHRW